MHEMPSKSIDVGYKAHNNALTEFGKTLYRPPPLVGIRMKKIREPQLFIIRNKYTKEVVDLEVSNHRAS